MPKCRQWVCSKNYNRNIVFIYNYYLLSSCIAIRVSRRQHRSFHPDIKCIVWNPASFYSYSSSESILGIIFFSILNDDAGMLHSELNCSSSFSRTANASANACHIHDRMYEFSKLQYPYIYMPEHNRKIITNLNTLVNAETIPAHIVSRAKWIIYVNRVNAAKSSIFS